MKFTDDMSYINKDLVNRGLAMVVPYSIRLDRYFSDEQKAENARFHAEHTEAEWNARCDEMRKRIAESNVAIMERIKERIKIGQYEKDYPKDYVLWFWCNCFDCKGEISGRDYSYITLTFRDRSDYAANEKVYEIIKEILNDCPVDNVQAIFQYESICLDDKIEEEAERFFKDNEGKFVLYCGYAIGKIFKNDSGYYFRKKNAKKYVYDFSPLDICKCSVINKTNPVPSYLS